jgi:4-phospho-D-threonate 3-dehydrogenase / 4-phospho-D-erythronate 3-dehydrogenase
MQSPFHSSIHATSTNPRAVRFHVSVPAVNPPARPTIAVSMGDPGGIGPEVLVKALADADLRRRARVHIYGLSAPLHDAARAANIDPYWWRVEQDSPAAATVGDHDVVVIERRADARSGRGDFAGEPFPAHPGLIAGELSFRWVCDAVAASKRPLGDPLHADAVCTGPINKQSWALAGHKKYPGHTELLKDLYRAKRVGMFFHVPASPPLVVKPFNVILATVHLPLMDIRNVLTIGRVYDAIDLGHEGCLRLGVHNPRIAVAGLNPHAGESGLLGDEEERLISPAIEAARESGMNIEGPFPGDTIFNAAVAGKFDLVVAMFHDQGLIPVKLLARDRAVNCSLGLPVIRTSPDHGTAFDIAGKNRADPGSMHSSLSLAARMAFPPVEVRNPQN